MKIDTNLSKSSISSQKIVADFFTLSNMKEFFSQFRVIFYGLTLFGLSHTATDKINEVFEEVKYSVQLKLNQEFETDFNESKQIEIQKIFQKVVDDIGHVDIYNPDFQKKLYTEIKTYEEITGIKLIQSLLLGFLYGFAYLKTIHRIKKEKLKIDVKSFTTFSLTSGGMVLVNGFVPGSVVYLESFLLAGYAVFLHLKNVVEEIEKKKEKSSDDEKDSVYDIPESKEIFLSPFENFHEPVVYYDIHGYPLLWNKQMEVQTGYTHKEVQDYYNEEIEKVSESGVVYKEKRKEVMSLLYRGANLYKVQMYLQSLKNTGTGYKNVTFTMTTKSGELKTFFWSVLIDDDGGNIRFARKLVDEDEIKLRIRQTEEKLLRDKLTGVYNAEAFEQDFTQLFLNKRKDKNTLLVMVDIDNFKALNDKYGHQKGDEFLQEFVQIIQQHIRETDKIYRLHGDEFMILFESNEVESILKKINIIRQTVYNRYQIFNPKISLSTSWGMSSIFIHPSQHDVYLEKQEKIKEVDDYMYCVKYLNLLYPNISQKNAIAYAYYDNDFILQGVKILNDFGEISLSLDEVRILNGKREKMEGGELREKK